MTKTVVALFSPNNNSASETFVRAHRDLIDADVVFYSDGLLPSRVNDQPIARFKYQLYYFILKKMGKKNSLSLEEYTLTKSLQRYKPDVVLCEYGLSANASLSVIRSLRLPLLVYFHGFDMSVNHVINESKKYAEVIGYASKMFVVSRDMEKKLIEFGASPNQVIYNPCAPNDDYFNIDHSPKPSQLFVAAGRFTNKKAPHLTILAFKKVLDKYPSAKLILAGDGELHQVCRDLSVYYNIAKSVELPGVFDAIQMKKWLEEAAAFVQHSVTAEDGNQEGTPVSVLEAMAAGVPVVATRHAGIKDIVIDNKTGYLVSEYDVDAMASKMCDMLEDAAKARIMGEAGREFVSKDLTMSHHIGKIDEAISEVSQMTSRGF